MFPARAQRGFTLVELLVVVLLIGILAAIALPRFLGQRTRAKNAAAQAAVRHALVAARSYYTQNSESYAGLGPSELKGYESSLSGTEPADGQAPGSSANPQDIWIGNGSSNNNPLAGDANAGGTVVLCSVSKGDTVYCIKDTSGVATYLAFTASGVSGGALNGSFTTSGWSSSVTVPTFTACGGLSYNACVAADSPSGWWHLDGDLAAAAASSGTNNGMAFSAAGQGPAGIVLGNASNRYSYGNSSSAWGSLPVSTFSNAGGTVSFELWFNNNGASGFARFLLFLSDTDPGVTAYGYQPVIYIGTDNKLRASWYDDVVPAAQQLASTGTYTDSSWHHVVFIKQAGTGNLKLYGDGVLLASGSITNMQNITTKALIGAGMGGFYTGAGFSATWVYNSVWIDELATYPAALTATQVSNHYNAGR